MNCLLCKYLSTQIDEKLSNYYIYFHQINENNYYFKELFSLDTHNFYSKYCDNCKKIFNSCRPKKNLSFLQHHQQAGGSANAQNNLPNNALKRGPITYFSMSYSLRSNFYNLFDVEKTRMVFLRL